MWKALTCGHGPSEGGSTPVRLVPSGPGRCRMKTGTTKEAGGEGEKASNQTTARAPRAPPLKASTVACRGNGVWPGISTSARRLPRPTRVSGQRSSPWFMVALTKSRRGQIGKPWVSSRLLPEARAISMPLQARQR